MHSVFNNYKIVVIKFAFAKVLCYRTKEKVFLVGIPVKKLLDDDFRFYFSS